jgi:hypothetical protein
MPSTARAAQQGIIKAKKDILDTLGNDIQKHMFNQVATQHLVTFGGQMSQHQAQQRVEYSATQAASRADSMRSMAMNSDIGSKDQNKYIEAGVQEIKNALKVPRRSVGQRPGDESRALIPQPDHSGQREPTDGRREIHGSQRAAE